MAAVAESSLIEAIMDARGQIDFLWQFFVTVHIAIFALLFIYDAAVEALNWVARIVSVFGVAAFEYINGNALINAYLLLDSMLEQYRMSYGQAARFHPAFYDHFVLANYSTRPGLVLMTHSTALAVVLIAFLSRRFIQSRGANRHLSAHLARGNDPEMQKFSRD
jgi:hypothetical protein